MAAAKPLLRSVNPGAPLVAGTSQAVIVESGRLMYLAGHVPVAADGTVPAGLEAQLELTFQNMKATLQAACATWSNVAHVTIYVRDFHADQLPVIRGTRNRFIDPGHPPATTTVGVANLFRPDVLVEVEAVAALPPAA